MRNQDRWLPSKFVRRGDRLVGNRAPGAVNPGSRLVTDIVARYYDEYLPLHARGRLIDLGCGRVPLFEAYEPYVSSVTCVDWPASLHGHEHLDCQCDLRSLPFEDECFDTIILSDVLEHLSQPDRTWLEMGRVLSYEGKLIMNVPFMYPLHEAPHDYFRYTEFALRRFAGLAGIEPIVLTAIGGAPEVLADVLAKNLRALPMGNTMSRLVQGLASRFVSRGWGKRVSTHSRGHFPLGYFLVGIKRRSPRLR